MTTEQEDVVERLDARFNEIARYCERSEPSDVTRRAPEHLALYADSKAEILRLRSRVEELEKLVQATVQGSGAVNDPVCQWQDISTALRDGTEALCYAPGFGLGLMVLYWSDGYWREKANCMGLKSEPSHWMPLPPPPGDRTDSSTAANVSLNQD